MSKLKYVKLLIHQLKLRVPSYGTVVINPPPWVKGTGTKKNTVYLGRCRDTQRWGIRTSCRLHPKFPDPVLKIFFFGNLFHAWKGSQPTHKTVVSCSSHPKKERNSRHLACGGCLGFYVVACDTTFFLLTHPQNVRHLQHLFPLLVYTYTLLNEKQVYWGSHSIFRKWTQI